MLNACSSDSSGALFQSLCFRPKLDAETLLLVKQMGFSDQQVSSALGVSASDMRKLRQTLGVTPWVKQVSQLSWVGGQWVDGNYGTTVCGYLLEEVLIWFQSKALSFLHFHLSFSCGGVWGTTDDFATSFLHFSLFSTALWDLANSGPVHFLMSSHLFFCLPRLLPPFTVPCKMVLARPDEMETCLYHFSLHLSTMVRRSSCGLIAGSWRKLPCW